MGLDMYLNKKTYVENWEHTPREKEYDITIKRKVGHHIKTERITEICEQIMYWRKANHIHKFFIDNCADGNDDCQEVYVELDTMFDLIKRLESVVEGKDDNLSHELLPTSAGFFFGSTEYDKYYYEECERTLTELQQLIDGDLYKGGDLYYQASW